MTPTAQPGEHAQPSSSSAPHTPCVVVGGGLAGSALAILLARGSHPVTLVEQHTGPHHKVCGDFLSAEAILYLRSLGLNLPAVGAIPIHTLRLATGSRLIETVLPFPAMSLTRFTLDESLLTLAVATGATVLRGSRAESLTHPATPFNERSEDTDRPPGSALPHPGTSAEWQLRLASGRVLSAGTVFLATGKHDLRGHPRPAGRHTSLIAFKHYLHLDPSQHAALGPAIELILFPHGYAGLQPVEPAADGTPRANLCIVVERDHLRFLNSENTDTMRNRVAAAGDAGPGGALLAYLRRVSPHLRQRLANADLLLDQPLALSGIPYGLLRRSPPALGLWPLGDQAAVIPSFTGDGMSIALHTAHLAAAMHLAGSSAADFTATLHRTLRRQFGLATLASRLAVRPALQPAIATFARFHPPLLRSLARATRIPHLTVSPGSVDAASQ